MRLRPAVLAIILAAWLLIPPSLAIADEAVAPPQAADEPLATPPYDQFIIIPLRVHVLTATDLPEVDCKLSDDDVRRIIGKVNDVVWKQAGIHFGVESIRREPAARQDDFRKWRELTGGQIPPLDVYPLLRPKPDARTPAEDAAPIALPPADDASPAAEPVPDAPKPQPPTEAPPFEGLHVYYVHELPTNGVYFGDGFAFVKETASLRPVEGGIDEPIPRVTAHELGHALGLPHRQNWTNLMASGTTGTLLNAAEVAKARETAGGLAGATGVDIWRERATAAEAAGDAARALQLWSWLADIPGDGAAEAAERRDAAKPKG